MLLLEEFWFMCYLLKSVAKIALLVCVVVSLMSKHLFICLASFYSGRKIALLLLLNTFPLQ